VSKVEFKGRYNYTKKAVSCLFFHRKSSNQVFDCLQVTTLSKCPGFCSSLIFHAWRSSRKCRIIVSYRIVNPLLGPQCNCSRGSRSLVWALSLNVTWLLALVASALAGGFGWAVSGEMSDLTAVVALLALGAVTCCCC
jgi:hypothetical protein